jgi:hypothetical protein
MEILARIEHCDIRIEKSEYDACLDIKFVTESGKEIRTKRPLISVPQIMEGFREEKRRMDLRDLKGRICWVRMDADKKTVLGFRPVKL